MRLNVRRTATGIAAAGLAVAGLAGGGVALASARPASAPAASSGPVAAAPVASGPFTGWCQGDGGWPGMPGWQTAQQPVLRAAAAYLGMSTDALRTQLQAGQSLADVASAHGKPVAGLEKAILAEMTSQINASSELSAAQKAAMIQALRAHLDDMVDEAGHGPGEMGRPGMHGGMGMWS